MQKPLTSSIIIPEKIQQDWQTMLNVLAELAQVPVALVMRIHEQEIEVFAANASLENPYSVGDKEALHQNLYCKHVLEHRQKLIVPNALNDPNWDNNPDLALNMIAYCGLPLFWPDNTPFGTICILDSKENTFAPTHQHLLETYQKSIEAQLNILFQHTELLHNHKKLQLEITENNKRINEINSQLANEIDCRRAAEQKVKYHKNHDVGTGFLNAFALYRHIDKLINSNQKFVLLHIHFANSRTIQQEHGHSTFDHLLTEYRSKLTKITDTSVTGRLDSSDILLIIHADKKKLPKLCQHLSEIGKACFSNNEAKIHLQSYIGAVHSKENASRNDLLKCAYNTVIECQSLGKTFTISDRSLPIKSSLSEHKIETYLLEAVRNNDLFLSYQPKVCPYTKRWVGSEALLRWNHPQLGAISNEVLIQLAERNGLIYELGNFALRNAIQQTSEWVLHSPNLVTAVNISAVQLKDPHFVQHVKQLLNLYKLPPKNLELEVTESGLIADEALAIETLTQLHNMGVSIALDDFGTGYASFQYLKKYPFDTLKIDKSFIENVEYCPNDQNIVCAMINIAKKLKLKVVVEGIENHNQERFVTLEGVDSIQGYLYSKPITADKFEEGLFNQTSIGTPYFRFM
ncbi:GGDEF and EAL domain-containing protein [Aliivibrio sp. S2TY2]|uniref:sensor domain-containing phosphodiesterase n=1 Tax=unclassified Aliivibrio TaxID=2645654 RepID=UPI0023793A68|nr:MULTISPECIES: GGDEF and EAL domain-containing protein [unclassified Aliivibrio]MDD9175198.1 GGDEF and EAL domain-containing protein [Aliivibrio sp. S3TY1]MDD9192277.1 GGDEF and EAL domain-containing protein [Aliivibrio sp. S2TY2]